MVRPERLLALPARPFGVALRAINLACGQVVELGLFGCREVESQSELFGEQRRGRGQGKVWCARRDYSRCPLAPSGSPYGRSTWPAAKLSNSACLSAGS